MVASDPKSRTGEKDKGELLKLRVPPVSKGRSLSRRLLEFISMAEAMLRLREITRVSWSFTEELALVSPLPCKHRL